MSVPTPLTGNLQSLRTRVHEAELLARELEQVETGTPTEVRNLPEPHNVGTGRLSDGWQGKFDSLDALLTEDRKSVV